MRRHAFHAENPVDAVCRVSVEFARDAAPVRVLDSTQLEAQAAARLAHVHVHGVPGTLPEAPELDASA